ncbi:MAG: hypothetical protein DRI86_15050 [Bacteroidetes bacterium]|nr:MAG: hypothetical protein DRI86_15050 [Bacteroidota bacterium]
MNKIILLFLFLIFSINSYSQGEIIGKITNKKTKESMVGVSVYIPELQKGIFSDENGKYSLESIPNGEFTIQYSYIGFQTTSKKININKPIKKKLDIQLASTYIYTPEVVISALGYSSQHDNAIKVEIISAKSLDNSANTNIMDNLELIPGIQMIKNGPGISSPNIRGLSLTNILVLNNGFRMNNYQFSENHPYLISNYGIDKVEVIKGPASLLYGSDAIGGVINFISEKPAPVGKYEADINAGYFSNTKGFETNIGVKAHGKKIYWGIRAGTQQNTDYLQANGEAVPNSRNNDRGIQLNIGANNKNGVFDIRYNYKENKIGLTTPIAKMLVKDRSYNNEMWFQELSYHQISSKNKIFLKNLKLESNFSFQTNHRKLFGTKDYVVDMQLQSFDYEFKAIQENKIVDRLIVGIQGNYTQNQNNGAPVMIIPNYYQNDFSVFSLIQQSFGKNLNFQAGIRYDFRNVKIPNINDDLNNNIIHFDTIYNNINFTIGATYHISDKFFLRANFASAYRTPNVAELSQDGIHGTRYEKGNINLVPQKSYEGDFGMHYHDRKLSLDASVFYNNINNYIFLTPTTDSSAGGFQIYQYQQTNSTLYGLEAGLNYVPIRMLDLKVNYSYTIGKKADGEYLPFIPQNKIHGIIKLKFKDYKVLTKSFAELKLDYAFAQNNVASSETYTSNYFLLNCGLGTIFNIGNQDYSLSIFVNNLLNTEYYDHLSQLKSIGYYNMGRNIGIKLRIPLGGNYGG